MRFSVILIKKSIENPWQLRSFYTSVILQKIVPINLKGKSKSSQDWLTRQLNDEYVKKSKYDNYRCRSAYKLLEMDGRFKILKPKSIVVDCGAAPGSWTQVVVRKLKLDDDINIYDKNHPNGLVVAVDLRHINPIRGAIILNESDFTDLKVQDQIFDILPNGKADVVLSDMAPNSSGNSSLDAPVVMSLVYQALRFSVRTLNKNGTFLCKVWDNCEVGKMINVLNNLFSTVKRVKPKASRLDSSELYLLASGFKGQQNNAS